MTTAKLPISSVLSPTTEIKKINDYKNGQIPLPLGPHNALVTCIYCDTPVKTTIKLTTTTRTHITAVLCGFVCCCCCIPYWCVDSARNADHYCPNCHNYLGTYER